LPAPFDGCRRMGFGTLSRALAASSSTSTHTSANVGGALRAKIVGQSSSSPPPQKSPERPTNWRIKKWELPTDWNAELHHFRPMASSSPRATSSAKVFGTAIAPARFPLLILGSADLRPSQKTHLSFETEPANSRADYARLSQSSLVVRKQRWVSILNGLFLLGIRASAPLSDLLRLQ